MKNYIKNRIRLLIKEDIIDGQEMNQHLQSLCNTMSVNSYHEVMGRVIAAIGTEKDNPDLWKQIKQPLKQLEKANYDINLEKHTDNDGNITKIANGMTGDSIPDESNTYWHQIQSVLCEQGPDFQ